jgi:dTDP-4-amino-4,6-dideoxygalactose transaminase
MIPFHKPYFDTKDRENLLIAMSNNQLSGDGSFTIECHKWFEKNTTTKKALLTTSCTHALEMAAILLNIKEGDEVIMPSYTFVSTANAFALRGAKIVFVDVRPDTMNIDEKKIESAITTKTKVIVPVHYAGVACEMDAIMDIANRYNLFVVEDAAQAITSTYKGKVLGTIGDLGTYSFHDTKNITCGEGGVLLVNNSSFIEKAEIIREKGTNRSQFFRGQVDKYSWKDIGSSYLPSELNAALLLSQLEKVDNIQNKRIKLWELYYKLLSPLVKSKKIELPYIPEGIKHNAHMFYIKVKDLHERQALIKFLKAEDILSVFHYVPLHTSEAGVTFGRFEGSDQFTTSESERLLRLPLFYELTQNDVQSVVELVEHFYNHIEEEKILNNSDIKENNES